MTRIISTPGTCGGEPRIAGTRIMVATIKRLRRYGVSQDDIIEYYPQLTLDDVASAVEYRTRKRPTRLAPRRVRRMAVLMIHLALRDPLPDAIELDNLAAVHAQSPRSWMRALKAARHYLRELEKP